MTLETKRLYLRPWEEGDEEALYQLAKDPEVGPDCGWKPHKDREESRYVLRRLLMNQYTWAIVEKDSGNVVGDISLMPHGTSSHTENEAQREIGFWLGRPYWGRGYMPEACRRLMDYAFGELNCELLWCGHHVDNQKSHRVQEKCGFRYHYREEEHYFAQLGIRRSGIVNRITREEWAEQKKQG